MKQWKVKLMGFMLLLGLVTSCIDEDFPSAPAPQPDAEMTLTLSFNTGARTLGTRVGDPGADHGENTADWSNIGIYLVYKSGRVLSYTFTKNTFESPKVYNVFSGEAEVYVVAFPNGQLPPANPTAAEVRNMKTLNVATAELPNKLHYMQNIFSGTGTINIIEGSQNNVTVICRRLVAKVDMQYDVQNGIDGGKFTEAAMSAVSFKGIPQAYIFPSAASDTELPGIYEITNLGAAISERNGRAYSYMFPGNSRMDFTVTYTTSNSEGEGTSTSTNNVTYNADFNSAITANTWYKVNFTVSGKNVSATGSVGITIGENSTYVQE